MGGSNVIKILYEDNHLLVVVKPVNMPVQEDESKDLDLLNALKEDIKIRHQKPGNVFLGLVHRLDRPVGGVMVFAKTSKAASRLSEQVRNHEMQKEYLAVVMNKVTPAKGTMIDHLLKDESTNIVSINSLGKEAILSYELLAYEEDKSLVKIDLKTGRSHQIRIQFASRSFPLYGDQKYNEEARTGQQIALFAATLSFKHPVTKEFLTYSAKPVDAYPWNIFKYD